MLRHTNSQWSFVERRAKTSLWLSSIDWTTVRCAFSFHFCWHGPWANEPKCRVSGLRNAAVTAANENWSPVTLAIARIIAACDVERLVSAYNQLKDTNRCKMSAETIDTYLNIRINMPPLAEFDIIPAVRWWMADKERRKRIPVKATKQAWFKGTFREADDESWLCAIEYIVTAPACDLQSSITSELTLIKKWIDVDVFEFDSL